MIGCPMDIVPIQELFFWFSHPNSNFFLYRTSYPSVLYWAICAGKWHEPTASKTYTVELKHIGDFYVIFLTHPRAKALQA
jgi:hypothetical protein